jgi:beta-glucosidase
LSNPNTPVHFEAGVARPVTIAAAAGDTASMQIRLAWLTPSSASDAIAEAVRIAKAAHTAIVFAYDEGQEGRDRSSLALPGSQDALIAAVAAANPRTVVVLNNGAPVLMPWIDQVPAVLQMWYPGQEGADATTALLMGTASPGGKLPVTFPKRVEDVPTNTPERYPGVDGHGKYSEGIYVGYRWYDHEGIAPLFPFGHGLSYTTFEYTNLTVAQRDGGYDVTFTLQNTGTRTGIEVPQVYIGRPSSPPAPMAERRLAGFDRVGLAPGQDRRVAVHLGPRDLSYWSTVEHKWVIVTGTRAIMVGASSRDIRLRTDITVR